MPRLWAPLSRRIVVTAVGGALAVTALALLGARVIFVGEAEESFERISRLTAIFTAERMEEPLSARDRAAISNLAGRDLGRGGVVAVVVLDRDRRPIAAEPAAVATAPDLTAWPGDEDQHPRFELGGVPVEARFLAVRRGGEVVGGVWLAVDRRPLEQARARFLAEALVVAAAVLGLSWFLAWLVARRLVRPLEELSDTLAAIGLGERGIRHPVQGPEEVRRLARRVNRVAEQLEVGAAEFERQLRDRTRQTEQDKRLLREIAKVDPLTQLLNRLGLEMEMERYLSLCRRSGQPMAVIMMDLDSFKAYNDTRGHAAGDTALATVAAALRGRARASDVVARLGGDEFCILIPFTKPERAVAAAEGFVSAVVDATLDLPRLDTGAQLGASAGVACFPEDGDEGADLLARADAALYRAKAAGRGRVFRASPQQPGQQS